MGKSSVWAAWFSGKRISEIAKAEKLSTGAICGMIAEVICAEYGGWGQVKNDIRLRKWAKGIEARVRTAIKAGKNDWVIVSDLRIGQATVKAIRSFLAPERLRTRGPKLRGRVLAKLEACWRWGMGPTRASRICDVPISSARSVFRRLDAGKALDSGFCYVYHNDGTGLEEIAVKEDE